MKTLSPEKSINLLKKIINCFPRKDLENAQVQLGEISNIGLEVLSHIRIPFATSDEEILKYVQELQLDKPENFIRFYMEASIAPAMSICDGINDLKRSDLYNTIAPINSAKITYLDLLDNPESPMEKEFYSNTYINLQNSIATLYLKIPEYIGKIQEARNQKETAVTAVDKLKRWMSNFGGFKFRNLETSSRLAKIAVQYLFVAINLSVTIAIQCGMKNTQNMLNKYFNFLEKNILSDDTCRLMHGWDDDPQDEFWLKIEMYRDQALVIADISKEIYDNEEENYDEIDFS